MIDPSHICLFIPPDLKKFKLKLFESIGEKIKSFGGSVIKGDYAAVDRLPDQIIPVIGCTPQFRPMIAGWQERGRPWVYWDRGYLRRVFATWLPRGAEGGYYRWHLNCFQMREIRNVPPDRWQALIPGNEVDRRPIEVKPWNKNGDYIVVAHAGGTDYADLHCDREWTNRLLHKLKKHTKRAIIVRGKEDKTPLDTQLKHAHALVTHGSIAAVEAVVMGCPVFVNSVSAAALMGKTDFADIENPTYPERERWLHSLAYCQFNENELIDGTLWRLIN